MSHFSVLVITDKLDKNEVGRKLQPFHEFECTGTNDEFVIDVDKTQEARTTYEGYTVTRYKDKDGNLHEADDSFYREPTEEEIKSHGLGVGGLTGTGFGGKISWTSRDWEDGKGYRAKVRMTAEEKGMEEVEIPAPDIMTFSDFIEYYYGVDETRHVDDESKIDRNGKHKHGYVVIKKADPKVRRVMLGEDRREANNNVLKYVDRTNPNKQWDWWVIGGRYGGRLRAKTTSGVLVASRGEASSFGMASEDPDALSYARIGDIDFEAMAEASKENRRKAVANAMIAIRGDYQKKHGEALSDEEIIQHWELYRAASNKVHRDWYSEWRQHDGELSFEDWLETIKGVHDPEIVGIASDLRNYGHVDRYLGYFGAGVDKKETVEEYQNKVTKFSAFAFIDLQGNWNEKGSMGWWGCVSDEKGEEDWEASFEAFMKDLIDNHGDKYLAVVDCHI